MQDLPDLWKFDGKVACEHPPCTLPLLLRCRDLLVLDLIFPHGRNLVNNIPWQSPAEVDKLMHCKCHHASCIDVIANVSVPSGPESFEKVERQIECSHFLILSVVGIGPHHCGVPVLSAPVGNDSVYTHCE